MVRNSDFIISGGFAGLIIASGILILKNDELRGTEMAFMIFLLLVLATLAFFIVFIVINSARGNK